jgi:hypothetical protein
MAHAKTSFPSNVLSETLLRSSRVPNPMLKSAVLVERGEALLTQASKVEWGRTRRKVGSVWGGVQQQPQ